MSFTSLGLNSALLHAVAEQGYAAPTAIQRAAIPAILQGRDVHAAAHTGSGKTAAFALPILQYLSVATPSARSPLALVLVPTRELAAQVGDVFRVFARSMAHPIKIVIASGGVSINPQMLAMRGSIHIVIATPGRLLDLVDHNALQLSAIKTLVLDEADRMLDLGFADELNRILGLLPEKRQSLLFSATFPDAIKSLTAQLLHDPIVIRPEQHSESRPAITQRAIHIDKDKRTPLLRHLLQSEGWPRTLVFVATKYATEHVADKLRRNHINAAALHGELSQGARTQALSAFKAGELQVLVATDLAGRGIDIDHLPAVVNYDLPRSTDDYVHRIGRTARAGASGIVVNFISADCEPHFRLIEKRQQLRITREQLAGFEPNSVVPMPIDRHGGIKGKRKSKKDKLREALAVADHSAPLPDRPSAAPASSFTWPTKPTRSDDTSK